jgi:hypothetical protein
VSAVKHPIGIFPGGGVGGRGLLYFNGRNLGYIE